MVSAFLEIHIQVYIYIYTHIHPCVGGGSSLYYIIYCFLLSALQSYLALLHLSCAACNHYNKPGIGTDGKTPWQHTSDHLHFVQLICLFNILHTTKITWAILLIARAGCDVVGGLKMDTLSWEVIQLIAPPNCFLDELCFCTLFLSALLDVLHSIEVTLYVMITMATDSKLMLFSDKQGFICHHQLSLRESLLTHTSLFPSTHSSIPCPRFCPQIAHADNSHIHLDMLTF